MPCIKWNMHTDLCVCNKVYITYITCAVRVLCVYITYGVASKRIMARGGRAGKGSREKSFRKRSFFVLFRFFFCSTVVVVFREIMLVKVVDL